IQQRVSAVILVSLCTINRIAKELKKDEKPSFCIPNQVRKNRKSKVALDDFDRDVLRRMIINFHATEGVVPTLTRTRERIEEEEQFKLAPSTDKQTILLRKKIRSDGATTLQLQRILHRQLLLVASEGEAVDREEKTFCVVCGMEFTGAHSYDICKNPVHAIYGNTVEEEGYGSRILCYLCQNRSEYKRTKGTCCTNYIN
ncbi:hypothetical protein ILUMI_17267, partial [Ignelater luminosus]